MIKYKTINNDYHRNQWRISKNVKSPQPQRKDKKVHISLPRMKNFSQFVHDTGLQRRKLVQMTLKNLNRTLESTVRTLDSAFDLGTLWFDDYFHLSVSPFRCDDIFDGGVFSVEHKLV